MSQVYIVYWSGTGNTAAMADFVAEGVKAGGAEAPDRILQMAGTGEKSDG